MPAQKKQILILGGGFAGISAIKTLLSQSLDNTEITLITNNSNFEYHAALYRVVTGHSSKKVSIPLKSIFKTKRLNIVIDRITHLDLQKQKVTGDAKVSYSFDYLIIALGSQTNYYNIKGLRVNSYQLKSLADAQKLKQHIEAMIDQSVKNPTPCLHFSIVGGGPTGIELAGELGNFVKNQTCKHHTSCKCLQIDLLESSNTLLGNFDPKISKIAETRLRNLNVNILKNTHITRENKDTLFTNIGKLNSKTVIWVAGVTTHALLKQSKELVFLPNGKVKIMDNLSVFGFPNVFIAGDNANLIDTGTAHAAISHGNFVGEEILRNIYTKKSHVYKPITSSWAIPIGPSWAVAKLGPFTLTGHMGWIRRKIIDLSFFTTILPFPKALKAILN